ncbi:riboflavin synthase [Nisaea acidiphila]|uniref:Riboflavin synthase n=1 Tax=Nisaea acidiphila TaxID=1862145 RepID=A0A9J7AST3_9PROT|nr:riboflavin synthase [Nisaea acidiphila]UUX50230.1 riboflavin synthase [Nisaea acidiphila]
MFTGIITHIGTVGRIEKTGDTRMTVSAGFDMADVAIGASIACSGCCLTVVDKGEDWFAADVSAETLSKTNLSSWQEGTRINLERALKVGDELGGHIVSGHVDGPAEIVSIISEGDSHRLTLRPTPELAAFVAQKGSVALDGISLTVNEVSVTTFGVNIIQHTWNETTLSDRKPGDQLNMEVDMLARYVARLIDVRDTAE